MWYKEYLVVRMTGRKGMGGVRREWEEYRSGFVVHDIEAYLDFPTVFK